MRVLVACEFSGVVRDAFRERGHDAWSCDLLPSEGEPLGYWYPQHYPEGHQLRGHQFHYQCDVRELFPSGRIYQTMLLESQVVSWDLLIAHPPCTRLCNSGVRWLAERNLWKELDEAAAFFKWLLDLAVPRICVENPVMHKHALARIGVRHTQSIQPWQFGHGETKETRLWLKNLPSLIPTNIVKGREPRVHYASPGKDRWKERSITYQGIADAMADQWGALGAIET